MPVSSVAWRRVDYIIPDEFGGLLQQDRLDIRLAGLCDLLFYLPCLLTPADCQKLLRTGINNDFQTGAGRGIPDLFLIPFLPPAWHIHR